MKKRVFLFRLLSCMLAMILISSQNAGDTNPIILDGELDTGSIRSSGDAIMAEVQGNVIMALFHKDVGNLVVSLINSAGEQVYETVVNTSVQQQAFIPLLGLPQGIYTITFSNSSGSMYGDFEI